MNNFDFIRDEKLKKQIDFAMTVDEMKNILRRNLVIDGSRRENDAEHSWHLAMMAMLLEEYSAEPVNIERVLKIALVHDLVEVYAGDTFAYDEKGNESKHDREIAAAEKLFGSLDIEQGKNLRALWNEFEQMQTPEARYTNAIDRIQPLILNYRTDGHTWKQGNVSAAQIYKRMDIIRTAAPSLWPIVEGIINTSIAAGILRE